MGLFSAIRRMLAPPAPSAPPNVQAMVRSMREVQASYDAARTTDEYQNYWANADGFDADSAHSREVRLMLMKRSRYEAANNGYADGIAQTYSTDLVGASPSLRMQTGGEFFNRMVELEWFRWTKAVNFRRKLWCMAHAKHVDGEGFGVMRKNPRVKHRIPLDLVLYEADQCTSGFIPFNEPGRIDGIDFDQFGNPEAYYFMSRHPGATNSFTLDFDPERVPADRVLHWFKMRRPGQHRGVPECASTLNLGAAFRRLREASLSTAEKTAAWTLFLKSAFPPEVVATADPMALLQITRGMMTTLPDGMEPYQLTSEQPGPQYDTFHDKLLNEQARPKNMPRNKAACDSSDYNYASGRLDHQTYYASLDVEREDCNEAVLDPLFVVWFDLAIARFGWLGGNPEAVGAGAREHRWDWPKHQVADIATEAEANQTKLKSGQIGLHYVYTEAGLDPNDEVTKLAEFYGVDEAVIRKRLLDVILPEPNVGSPPAGKPVEKPPADPVAAHLAERFSLNGNGAVHAN